MDSSLYPTLWNIYVYDATSRPEYKVCVVCSVCGVEGEVGVSGPCCTRSCMLLRAICKEREHVMRQYTEREARRREAIRSR